MLSGDTASGAWLDRSSTFTRYSIGLCLFAAALATRFLLVDVLPERGFPFLTFFPAVFLTAFLAGLVPGLIVSALSLLAAWYFFIPPVNTFMILSRSDVIALLFFAGILFIDCIVIHFMNVAVAKLRCTSDRLRVSEAALQDSDRKKNIFMATLAHELRNPIASVRAATHLIGLSQGRDAAVHRAAAVIDRQSAQLARLVDDLLDMSRIESGKLNLRCFTADLRAVVKSAVETCRPLIDESGCRVDVAMPSGPVFVHIDETRIAQCVANLLHNAVKFSQPGAEVSVQLASRPERVASIVVKDRGCGISTEMLPQLFEMFSQERRSGMGGNSGLGIGLALTRRLMDLHGGQVLARSEGSNRGAEFELLLPLAAAEPVPSGSAGNLLPDELPHSEAENLVLIIDDNRDSTDMLTQLLELHNFRVITAFDGQTGLDMMKRHRPKIVLLDIGLPDISGHEVARLARTEGWLSQNALLIALTGWGDDRSKNASAEAGIDVHLIKPVDFTLLLELLRERVPPAPAT